MQPAASPQRVERNASAYEQKKNNLRHDSHNGSGVRHADVTACPIYASVGEKLDVPKPETHVYVNNTHKFHRLGSDVKPLKKGLCFSVQYSPVNVERFLRFYKDSN